MSGSPRDLLLYSNFHFFPGEGEIVKKGRIFNLIISVSFDRCGFVVVTGLSQADCITTVISKFDGMLGNFLLFQYIHTHTYGVSQKCIHNIFTNSWHIEDFNFQQDGVPPHYYRDVSYIKQCLPSMQSGMIRNVIRFIFFLVLSFLSINIVDSNKFIESLFT